jgi:hypothetical protein
MTETPEVVPHKHTTHRRPFGTAEDAVIMKAMLAGPFEPWDAISRRLPGRTARQCRERWANYLSPAIRSDPWTPEEDRILIEKINEMGFSWSSIAHSFNGRSDNDIKNRWYSHLRYETVNDGTKYVFAGTGADSPYPERKKRNRLKICPKQSAFSLLEQQRASPFTHTVPMIVMPKPVREQPPSPPGEVEDIWDRMILEEGAEEPFTFTLF